MATGTTVDIRMYNVGFGDAFVVTVKRGAKRWRALIDCGVHSHGAARPIEQTVAAIVADLKADTPAGADHLDVVVATHHHADHITGFAVDLWATVTVGEVWVSFVEDPSDADGKALRARHQAVTARLSGLIDTRTSALGPGEAAPELTLAAALVANSRGNDRAMARLLGTLAPSFAKAHKVRYLPSTTAAANDIATPVPGAIVHVFGPSRDPDQLKRMDPPVSAGWLPLDPDGTTVALDAGPIFNERRFAMGADELTAHPELTASHRALANLHGLNDAGLLAAASVLEQSVNNTSVFLVLEVGRKHFCFPGDAQQGAWDHVLGDPVARAMLADAVFYKISHHGSQNGTPREFVEQVLTGTDGNAMLPWGLVEQWKNTIPNSSLLDALGTRRHILRADRPVAAPPSVAVHDTMWSQISYRVH